MELKIDLHSGVCEKSKTRIVLGALLCLYSAGLLLFSLADGEPVRASKYFNSAVWLLFGIVQIIEGAGIPISKFFGKAYLIINDEKIVSKNYSGYREKSIYWDDISSVEYVFNTLYITRKNKTKQRVLLSQSSVVIDVAAKEFVEEMCREKGIEMTFV